MDTAVRQRLLGGIVLIAGAAILLPLMLDGSGAKLLSRLEALPAKPATATVEQVQPELNQQQREAEDEVSAAHNEETPFYSLSKPTDDTKKDPEQIAADLAAKKRTAELLGSTEEVTPEQALKQKQEAEKALAMLEATDGQAQQEAEARLAEQAAQQKIEQLAAIKLAQEKAQKKEEEKAKLALEGKLTQDDVSKAEKLAAEKANLEAKAQAKAEKLAKEEAINKKLAEEKLKAEKSAKEDKLAQEKAKEKSQEEIAKKKEQEKLAAKKQAEAEAKAERLASDAAAKKKEEEKAKLALEGKLSDKSSGEAWVVQVASLSDKVKADALSSKLAGKGYRTRVVKSGDSWKVVVGPELDKTKAQTLKSKINDDDGLGVSGAWVAPWKP